MKVLFLLSVCMYLSSCEYYSQRIIENNTKFDIWINLYKIQSLRNNRVSLPDTIKAYSQFKKSIKGKNVNVGFLGGPYPDVEIDSLVFTLDFQDSTYRKVLLRYDTSNLFRCLNSSSQETCIINYSDLEGARLVE